MDKLTLEHIAPYLPYSLEFTNMALDCFGNIETRLLTPTSVEPLLHPQNDKKPILRPLSDLSKEIDHKGERFVPMVELYKIARGRYKDSIVKYWSVMSPTSIMIEQEGFNNYIFSFVNSDCDVRLGIGLNFQLHSTDLYNDNPKTMMVQCWNVLFEKLKEWHFDIYELLPKGLAIDINSIEGKETKGNG